MHKGISAHYILPVIGVEKRINSLNSENMPLYTYRYIISIRTRITLEFFVNSIRVNNYGIHIL